MAAGKKKVVLAEDDRFISKAFTEGLERAGFEVHIALNGEEAIKKVREVMPDVLLLDIIMPLKNGFEVIQELKLDEALKNIPIMVLSNLGQEDDKNRALTLGAVDYLVKSNNTLAAVLGKVKDVALKAK